MQRVINFSGGRTSAYMTIHEYKPGDIVLFCDTGREHEKTYKFIHDFEAFEGIPVIWLKHPGGFEDVLKKESIIPNQWKRKCTIQLKVKNSAPLSCFFRYSSI
jgi:3'-phosphoadenosine 5'-phosphosulfate sulfotransferase (PAPS reductase)/FAD synthetase